MLKVNRLRLHELSLTDSPGLVAKTASAIAICMGCLVIIGWQFDIQVLKSLSPDSIATMKANTALCFVLSGVSLWLLQKQSSRSDFRGNQERITNYQFSIHNSAFIISRLCAVAVAVIALLTLSQYCFGWNLGIDELLFRDSPQPVATISPGRMGLNTAVNFILVGIALLLLSQNRRRSYWYAQIFALLAGFVSLQALIGYAYKVQILYGIVPYTTSMALNTALMFIVLCVGILWLRVNSGWMRVVTSDSYGGLLARRLLLAAIAVPFGLGWLILQGLRAAYYDPAFAISLFAIALIAIFAAIVWTIAAQILRISTERDGATAALMANEQKLRSFVESNIIGIIYGDVKGGISQANDELLRIIGYTREDLGAGRIRWSDITPPEHLYLDERGIAEAKATGACTPYEKEYIRKDGSRVPILLGYVLLGQREESVAFILDLSDRKRLEQAQNEANQRITNILETITDNFIALDRQWRITYVNQATAKLSNLTPAELIGKSHWEVSPWSVGTIIEQEYRRALATGEATHFEVLYEPLNKWLEIHAYPAAEGLNIYFRDITERKQAEKALQNQQQWLEEVLNLMPTPMLFIEPKTARVSFANRAAHELAGGEFPLAHSAEEYYTTYYSTDAAGNPIESDRAPGVRVARGERLQGFELDWHLPKGMRSLLIDADTLPEMHGHAATCLLVFQDITKLKQIEKALSLGNDRLKLLFETASDLLSSQQPLELVHSLFAKLREQIGLDCYINYLIDDNQLLRLNSYSGITLEVAKQIECLEIGQAVCGTVALERRQITVENMQQSTDPKTELCRSIGITAYSCQTLSVQERFFGTLSFGSRTRTSFTHDEIEMMQAVCDQIAIAMERASLIDSLQQQAEQLREANRLKDEFLAVLSHELRSPLNAILGWAQILRSRQISPDATAKALETIERNAKAQTQLVEDLLDVSRIIKGKLHLNVTACELVPIIESALDTVRLAAAAKGISLEFHGERGRWGDGEMGRWGDGENYSLPITNYSLPIQNPKSSSSFLVSGDPERLQQVIWNLLSNAIKFTPKQGRVEIRLSKVSSDNKSVSAIADVPINHPVQNSQVKNTTDYQLPITNYLLPTTNYAQIQVTDTGIGIKSDFLPYVFDRFRQADGSITRAYGGLGLGLAIVRHLVELHGGTVSVDSAGEGQGATFTVNIPLLERAGGAGGAGGAGEDSTSWLLTPDSCILANIRVLVVDDEADTRDYLTTVLQEYGAEVQAVAGVREALAACAAAKPDVILSDIGMPEEDGYALIRQLRSLYPQEKIPVAALTAYAMPEERTRAIQAGFELHLSKPIEPASVLRVVTSLTGRNK